MFHVKQWVVSVLIGLAGGFPGYDIAGTVGIIALNFILGGIIGGVILIWRLVVAAWYIPLTIYRLLTTDKGATPQINMEK